ncbi:MAG: fluoride efflux transporter CrcB [Proteobacteria bacterium]|nr:fluoride efflux transporter CrcB [Pseudomonadota bacterium]
MADSALSLSGGPFVSVSSYLFVGLGSAFGGMARFGLSDVMTRLASPGESGFPWGTLIANVSGCFLIALLAALTLADGRPVFDLDTRQFLMAGFLGGYTTFSAFGLQTLELAQAGDWSAAGLNVGLSVVASLVAVWLGWLAGSAVTG